MGGLAWFVLMLGHLDNWTADDITGDVGPATIDEGRMGIFDEIIEGLFNPRLKGGRQAVKHVMSK